jgi:hypothetical protein
MLAPSGYRFKKIVEHCPEQASGSMLEPHRCAQFICWWRVHAG